MKFAVAVTSFWSALALQADNSGGGHRDGDVAPDAQVEELKTDEASAVESTGVDTGIDG